MIKLKKINLFMSNGFDFIKNYIEYFIKSDYNETYDRFC